MKDTVKDIKGDIWEGEYEFQRIRMGLKKLPLPISSVHVTPSSRKEYISEVRKFIKRLEACHEQLLSDEVLLRKLLR